MTKLQRPVTRQTTVACPVYPHRPLVVQLEGGVIRIRRKGERQWLSVALTDIYRTAVRNRQEAVRSAYGS